MMAFLKALAWLRWRSLVNALGRTGVKDLLGRLTFVGEHILPIILALLLVPSAIGLAAAGGWCGWTVARGQADVVPMAVLLLRAFGGAFMALAVFAPFMFSAGSERASLTRFQLLPVPVSTIHAAELGSRLADPWLAVFVPMLLLVPVGMAAAGRVALGALALALGVLLLVAAVALSVLVSTVLHLVLRNRRRGELATLVLMALLSSAGWIPALVGGLDEDDRQARSSRADPAVQEPRPGLRERAMGGWLWGVPSEMYVASIARAATLDDGTAAMPLAVLLLSAVALERCSAGAYRRLLETPESGGSRNRGTRTARLRLPGLPPAVAAVAACQIRYVLRTLRGKLATWGGIPPIVAFSSGLFPLPLEAHRDPVALAILTTFIAVLALQPMALNQLADHGPGLTLEFLSPLRASELLRGRLIGNALVAAATILLYAAVPLVFHRLGSPLGWLTVVLGGFSVFLTVSPFTALLAIVFPKHVNLNTLGRAGSPGQLSVLLGLVATAVAILPPVGLALGARSLPRPDLSALLLVAVWTVASAALAVTLVDRLGPLMAHRSEELIMAAEGRS